MNNEIILISLSQDELKQIIKTTLNDVMSENQKKSQEKELLSAKELCQFLGISSATLSKWKSQGKIPSKKLGKRVFFKRQDVLDALKDSHYGKLKELSNSYE